MTKKQILSLAITRFQALSDTEENQMIIDGLTELINDLPITGWDAKTMKAKAFPHTQQLPTASG